MTFTSTNVGGMYTDPFHSPTTASANLYNLPGPWLGGLRFLGRTSSDNTTNFICIGCDDGIHFWTLYGDIADSETGKVTMDFTPKAPGVGLLQCGFDGSKGVLHFYEDDGTTIGNTWSRLTASATAAAAAELTEQTKHAAFNAINGLFVDAAIRTEGNNPLAGIRIISDRKGKFIRDELCMIGTDDGIEWWAITGGKFTDKVRGKFEFVGGDASRKYVGGIKNGTIELDDGSSTKWTKMIPKADLHALPKQSSL